jgi:hypothetical protein
MQLLARRGLVAAVLGLVLAGMGLVATQAPAFACTCVRDDVASKAERADVVLSGTLTQVRREQTGDRPRLARLTYVVEVDRAYQGAVTRETVEITSSADTATCGLGRLTTDRRYVFFATARGSALSTNRCSGTGPASAGLVARVREVLGVGRAIGVSPPEPDPPVATTVDDSPPPEFGRTAAPGAALAIVGLLGLLVVRRRARS